MSAVHLKRINFETETQFTTRTGNTYFVELGMNSERLAMWQRLEVEAGLSVTYKTLFDGLGNIREALNTFQAVPACVIVDNLQRGIAKLEDKHHSLLRMCALIINHSDEDRTTITEDMITRKIEDWKEFDTRDFFTLALNKINGFIDDYLNVSRIISAQDKKAGQNLKEEVQRNFKAKKLMKPLPNEPKPSENAG
jgi:hypothetical protein